MTVHIIRDMYGTGSSKIDTQIIDRFDMAVHV